MKFGDWFHENSAFGKGDKRIRSRARRNRIAYMRDRRAIENWAGNGFLAGLSEAEENSYGEDKS